jgi:hypothetical protein
LMLIIVVGTTSTSWGQSLSATTLLNSSNTPLSIISASQHGMPIRVATGPLGQIRSLEIDSQGGTWLRGPLSIGQSVGALSSEQVRIGSVAPSAGMGLVISMSGTQQSTGISIRDIGLTGSEHAGIVIASQANGIGTGIRIGGQQGSSRPTLQTGLDITGGLGIRYNALNAGVGTAIEIGGTNAPRRGIEVVVSGTDHIAVIGRANTNGTGIIGASQSSSSEPLIMRTRTGLMGYAASNSSASADTLVGVYGQSVRAGPGGTQTLSIGMHGRAVSRNSLHSGTSIGVLGDAQTSGAGSYCAIAGCFLGDSLSIALVALGGDVVLGGTTESLPTSIVRLPLGSIGSLSTVYMYDAAVSGRASITKLCLPPAEQQLYMVGNVNIINVGKGGVCRVNVPNNGVMIGGVNADTRAGSVVHFIPINGPIILLHDEQAVMPNQRLLLPGQVPAELIADVVHAIWYDETDQRWRLLR